jgi:hypothetical protein
MVMKTWSPRIKLVLNNEFARFRKECLINTDISVRERNIHADIYSVSAVHKSGKDKLRFVRQLVAAFDGTCWMREPHQRHCHEELIKSAINIIYGADFEACYADILRENEWEGIIKHESAIGMPRRFGKTILIAMLGATFLLALSGTSDKPFKIAIFSPGQRQSSMLLNHVKKFVKLLIETLGLKGYSVKRSNTENLQMVHPDGSESHIVSFPCSKISTYVFLAYSLFLCLSVCLSLSPSPSLSLSLSLSPSVRPPVLNVQESRYV